MALNILKNSIATGISGDECDYLFNHEKLTKLSSWPEMNAQLRERGLIARPLQLKDYELGYLELLAQLTKVGTINNKNFEERFAQMRSVNLVKDHYVIVVIEDISTRTIVAASTLFLEFKFIHQCAVRGRLEDVAVLQTYRGKQIGEIIVRMIVDLAREAYECYKISLDCKDELVKFYSKNNFSKASNMLCIRFRE